MIENLLDRKIKILQIMEGNLRIKNISRNCGGKIQKFSSPSFKECIEVCFTALYTINWLLLPSDKSRSPYELLFNKLPDYSYLRGFGTLCYPLLPKVGRDKFFLGYALMQKDIFL